MDIETPEDTYGDGSSPGGVTCYHLPFRNGVNHQLSIPLLLHPHRICESDVPHQLVQFVIIVTYRPLIRCLVVIHLQDSVGSLGVNGILVYVDNCHIPGFLLGYLEKIPVKAGSVYPYHIGMPLIEITRQDKHIPHPGHHLSVVRSFPCIESVYVKVSDPGDIIRRQGNLVVSSLWQLDIVVGG